MKLSIITVTLNNSSELEKTIESIINQKKYYSNIEYIIIDGGSTDDTNSVIRKHRNHINLYISEPDNGIYDAMNKGIKLSSGKALLFLNAGDYFVGDVLSDFKSPPCFLPVKYIDIFQRFKSRAIEHYKTGIPNCHQGIIFERKNIYYNTQYKISADYEFYLEHNYKNNINYIHCPGYIFFDTTGVSSKKIKERDLEIFMIRRQYIGLLQALLFETWPFFKRLVRKTLIIAKN